MHDRCHIDHRVQCGIFTPNIMDGWMDGVDGIGWILPRFYHVCELLLLAAGIRLSSHVSVLGVRPSPVATSTSSL